MMTNSHAQIAEDGYTLSDDVILKINYVLRRRYLRYLDKTNSIVFTILSSTRQAKLHLSSNIMIKVILFGCVIYFSADAYCQKCVSGEKFIT